MKMVWPLLLIATLVLAEEEQWTKHESVFGRWHGEAEPDRATEAATTASAPVGIIPLRDGAILTVDVLAARDLLAQRTVPTRTAYYEGVVPAWDGGMYADASGGIMDAGVHIQRIEEEVPMTRWEQAKDFAKRRPVVATVALVASGFVIHWAGDRYIWGGDGSGGGERGPSSRSDTRSGDDSTNITIIGDGNSVTVNNTDSSYNQPIGP